MGDRRRSSPGYRGGGGRGPPPPRQGVQERGGYKVICVSSLHKKASDDVVRDTLYREYRKYGDISVRVMHEPDERVAYVYFRSFEDARDALHSKSRIILFDKPAQVEAVYESASREEYESRAASISPPRYGGDRGGGRGGDRRGDYGRPRTPERYRDDWDRRGPPPRRDDYRGPPPRRDDYHDEWRGGHDGGRGRGRGRGGFRGGRGGGGYHDIQFDDDYGGSYGPTQRRENKKDRFPNYLEHIQPEDDPLATRTLFVGNLELNITLEEMKRIFGKHGDLIDIDIKRPPPNTGNAFAFLRYRNLDMAASAKRELSGQYIGKFQCKVGYGKIHKTSRVWLGALGDWCTRELIEREFDRFGAMGEISYQPGDTEAVIQYESIEAAGVAVNEMRGFALGGPGKRIRIDYADDPSYEPPKGYQGNDFDPTIARGRGGGRGGFRGGRGGDFGGRGGHRGNDSWGKRSGDDLDGPPSRMRRLEDDHRGYDHGRERESNGSSRLDNGGSNQGVSSAKSVTDLSKRIDKSWEGGIILKNSLFPTRLLLTEGDRDIAENLLMDENEKPYLKITQRLRLDEAKLEDVSKRINSSSSHAIYLSLSTSSATVPLPEGQECQSRPLKNLVSYLKQKDAAGVISLSNKATEQSGVLYAFPPCNFSLDLLRRVSGDLSDEGSKDDHLVVVVVKGG